MLSKNRFRRNLIASVLLVAALQFAVGCSDDPTNMVTLAASFQGAPSLPNTQGVAMSQSAAAGSTVTVAIDVIGVSDVYGASFRIVYDSVNWTFVSWAAGSALEQGGAAVRSEVVESDTGTLTIGTSRLGPVAGANVADRKALLLLTFRGALRSASPLTFESPVLFDASNPPQEISGLAWFGGTLVFQ